MVTPIKNIQKRLNITKITLKNIHTSHTFWTTKRARTCNEQRKRFNANWENSKLPVGARLRRLTEDFRNYPKTPRNFYLTRTNAIPHKLVFFRCELLCHCLYLPETCWFLDRSDLCLVKCLLEMNLRPFRVEKPPYVQKEAVNEIRMFFCSCFGDH